MGNSGPISAGFFLAFTLAFLGIFFWRVSPRISPALNCDRLGRTVKASEKQASVQCLLYHCTAALLVEPSGAFLDLATSGSSRGLKVCFRPREILVKLHRAHFTSCKVLC